jgi:hypothetical protein
MVMHLMDMHLASAYLIGVYLIRRASQGHILHGHASQRMFLAQFSGAKSSAKGATAPRGTHAPFATGLTRLGIFSRKLIFGLSSQATPVQATVPLAYSAMYWLIYARNLIGTCSSHDLMTISYFQI